MLLARTLYLTMALAITRMPIVAKAQLTPLTADARLTVRASDAPKEVPLQMIGARSNSLAHTALLHAGRALASDTSKSASHAVRNGFLIGASIGFASAFLICDGASCHQTRAERIRFALLAAAVDGAVGALIGWKVANH